MASQGCSWCWRRSSNQLGTPNTNMAMDGYGISWYIISVQSIERERERGSWSRSRSSSILLPNIHIILIFMLLIHEISAGSRHHPSISQQPAGAWAPFRAQAEGVGVSTINGPFTVSPAPTNLGGWILNLKKGLAEVGDLSDIWQYDRYIYIYIIYIYILYIYTTIYLLHF